MHFDVDSSNAPGPDVNTFQGETCFVHDQTNHVSAYCKHGIRQSKEISS